MPRTAKTLAITHDGKDLLLAGPSTPLLEQRELVKKIRFANGGGRVHPEYASVIYQESDGPETTYRFITPETHEARQKQIDADNDARAKQDEAHKTVTKKTEPNLPQAPVEPEGNAPYGYDKNRKPNPKPAK